MLKWFGSISIYLFIKNEFYIIVRIYVFNLINFQNDIAKINNLKHLI